MADQKNVFFLYEFLKNFLQIFFLLLYLNFIAKQHFNALNFVARAIRKLLNLIAMAILRQILVVGSFLQFTVVLHIAFCSFFQFCRCCRASCERWWLKFIFIDLKLLFLDKNLYMWGISAIKFNKKCLTGCWKVIFYRGIFIYEDKCNSFDVET